MIKDEIYMIGQQEMYYRYYDKNGIEITEGCIIMYDDGRKEKIYMTDQGELGIDATNPSWIERGIAVSCEFGIYPLTNDDCDSCEVMK